MKIAIGTNRCGFGLSDEALRMFKELSGKDVKFYWDNVSQLDEYTERNDPYLIKVIETLGAAANTEFTQLKIVEIPDDVQWEIMENDLGEYVAEKHRVWR